MKTKLLYITVIVGLFFTLSCKKDDDEPKQTCRLITVADSGASSGATVYSISYNNDGKISTLTTTGGSGVSKVFTYTGNTVLSSSTSFAGNFVARDSSTIDTKGRPLNIRQFSNKAGTSFTNYSFEYSGDDLLRFTTTTQPATTPQITIATSQNGNLIKLQAGNSVQLIEYFTDKKVQPGDYLELSALVQYGMPVFPHKNLVKSISSGGSDITNFNYEFGADGLITKVIATQGNSVTALKYQYQCQ